MPMLELTLPEGALNPDALSDLMQNLCTIFIKGEGAPDNEYTRSLTWMFVDERPKGCIRVGGNVITTPRYRIRLTVPEGAPLIFGPLMEKARTKLVRRCTEAVLAAEGTAYSDREAHRVWIQILEIKEGYWGAGGQIVKMNDIGTFVLGTPSIGTQTAVGMKWRNENTPPSIA